MARRRLPPLSALRAFEVASRQLSFKRTADELCITATAVSHRIRSLEDWLGVKLFNRLTRSIELTKEGEAYAPRVRAGFELLADASDDLLQAPRVDYRWSGYVACDPSWTKWFALHDIVDPADHPLPTFSEEHLALSQAVAGRGVAPVGIVAAADAILDGRLVRPFPIGLENRTYYSVSLPDQLARRKIQAFRDWLKDEAVCFEQQLIEDARLRFEHVAPAQGR